MKTIIFSMFLLVCNVAAFAQDIYTLRIIDTQGQPVKNVEVTAQNKAVVLKAKTDNAGSVVFTLTASGTYTFSYLEMKDVTSYEVKEGMRGTFKRTTTYDPQGVFTVKPKIDRTGIIFRTMAAQQLKGQPNMAKVTVEVKEKTAAKVPGLFLELTSCSGKVKYQGTTNASGMAVFYIPINEEYEIDIAGMEAYQKFNVPNQQNGELHEVVYYEKTNVKETAKGDTIIQRQVTQTTGTSTHLLFTLHLNNYNGNPLPNEPVYVDAQNKKRVYQGATDEKGTCVFMLEKGTNYLVNLKYEREIHLVEATGEAGFFTSMITRRYRGSSAIEEMLAEQKRNEQGFVVDHEETPIRVADRPDFLKKTAQGFNVNFGSSGPIGTPTIADNKLFSQEGFYSPNFHCLQAATGEYLWGVELGESGMSPAVFHDGVLLINTYSCTLYALEASTGKMLWSKWLAGTIYSTPSADGNSVYVVYNNRGANPLHKEEHYAITCFDLRTGKVNWMNWVDKEVIACPVVEGNEVHVASHSGNYYVFDKKTGKLIISSHSISAVSSPTLTPGKVFITASVNGKEQLIVLDRATLQIRKKYPIQLTAANIGKNHDSYAQMNFNGPHPIVYKNKVILLLDSARIVAFDANSEKLLWQKPVRSHPNQIPIVANDKVVIGTNKGEIISYDINTGASQVIHQSEGALDGQPVTNNGLMYLASAGMLTVLKTIQTFQWTQWNKDARHNAYWE